MVQIIEPAPSFGTQLARGLGAGLSQALGSGAQQALQRQSELQKEKSIVEALIKQGVPQDKAQLYSKLTTGGQTELVKNLLESEKRGMFGSPKMRRAEQLIGSPNSIDAEEQGVTMELSPDEQLNQQIEEIQSDQDIGLTPAERVKRQTERFKIGHPIYQEAGTKLKGFARDKERIGVLESLNSSDKLPKNFGRLNVDKEGNLRFPFMASAEAQRYVKTLNEFSQGAKDTFGSRVTNFDLSQFLKRFPNLLNSQEGRRQIAQQMKIVNDINSVYYKNLKNVYERAGGVRKIDPDQAEMLAEKLSESQVTSLAQKFSEIGQFASKPNPQEFKGKKIKDRETGEILISDGNEWIPAGG